MTAFGVRGNAIPDEIVLKRDDVLTIFTQDTPYPGGEQIYAPIRDGHLSSPNWETNGT